MVLRCHTQLSRTMDRSGGAAQRRWHFQRDAIWTYVPVEQILGMPLNISFILFLSDATSLPKRRGKETGELIPLYVSLHLPTSVHPHPSLPHLCCSAPSMMLAGNVAQFLFPHRQNWLCMSSDSAVGNVCLKWHTCCRILIFLLSKSYLHVILVEQNIAALSLGWANCALMCVFICAPVRWENFMNKQKPSEAGAAGTDSVCDMACLGYLLPPGQTFRCV